MDDRPVELGAPSLGEPEKRALMEVIDDGWVTMGDRVRRFELRFAEIHGVEDAVAVSSATAALQLSLAAFDVGAGDEVLVPSLTFVATANVVVHAGAAPVFVDVEAVDRPHVSIGDARRKLSPRTKAIFVMHYGGYGIDLAPWRELADEFGLLLFEDAAHATGLSGVVGTLSDAASFSFFTNKNMTTAEGGMLLIRDPDRLRRARLMRAHGMTSSTIDRDRGHAFGYDVVECGHNFRMDELRGAMGLVQIERLGEWNERRRELGSVYRSELGELAPEVTVPFSADHPTSGHLMPVVLPRDTDRAGVMTGMRAAGIQTSVHYPPVHRFSFYERVLGQTSLPRTEDFSARELTLPLHPGLDAADVDRVVKSLCQSVEASS
jgi:dTDP-4-amino-4,6-dideoxygalactose transaminase